MKHILTEEERAAMTHALTIAAERFEEDMKTMLRAANDVAEVVNGSGIQPFTAQRLAAQFERQAKDAREMASRIESAYEIVIEERYKVLRITESDVEDMGDFETLEQAKGAVAYDHLTKWEIWLGDVKVEGTADAKVQEGGEG